MISEIREWAMFLAELYVCWILTAEYYFDKVIYEQKRRRIKRTHNTVRISVEDGQVVILEKPENVDVVTEHKGE